MVCLSKRQGGVIYQRSHGEFLMFNSSPFNGIMFVIYIILINILIATLLEEVIITIN